MDAPRVPTRDWNPEKMINELMLESQFDGGDAAASASRLLREHALVAAQSIAHLAAYGHNERVRFQAASYIVDRVLGGRLEDDIKLQQAQIKLVGQTLSSVVRALGMKFNFDPDAQEVRVVTNEAIMAVSRAVDGSGEAA